MRRGIVLRVAISALILGGCAANSAEPGSSPASLSSVSGNPLADAKIALAGTFEATSVTGHELVPGSILAMSFVGDAVSVRAGCNDIDGRFAIEAGRLTIRGLSSTEMGCEQALMDQDAWVAAFLSAEPSATLDNETLLLQGHEADAASLALRLVSSPTARSLKDSGWMLESIITGDVTTGVPMGVLPTLYISADAQLTLDAGCNSIHGTVVVGSDALTITDLVSTEMACDDVRADMEELLTAVVSGEVAYAIDGDTLRITGADGTELVFVAPDATTPAAPGADAGSTAVSPTELNVEPGAPTATTT